MITAAITIYDIMQEITSLSKTSVDLSGNVSAMSNSSNIL